MLEMLFEVLYIWNILVSAISVICAGIFIGLEKSCKNLARFNFRNSSLMLLDLSVSRT